MGIHQREASEAPTILFIPAVGQSASQLTAAGVEKGVLYHLFCSGTIHSFFWRQLSSSTALLSHLFMHLFS
jgi:hypothetical protein